MRSSALSSNGACSRFPHACFTLYISPGHRASQPYNSTPTSSCQSSQLSTKYYSIFTPPPSHQPCATKSLSAIQSAGVYTTAIPSTRVNGSGSADTRQRRRQSWWDTLAPTIPPGPRRTTLPIPDHPAAIAIGATLVTRAATLLASHSRCIFTGAFEGAAVGSSSREKDGGRTSVFWGSWRRAKPLIRNLALNLGCNATGIWPLV